MSWLNPVALVGLLALALPILVHLFGRRVAKRLRFPSLRLLREANPTPATRSRPSDVVLLVLRCLTIAAAVAALAQPGWSDAGSPTARVIIVDTSGSMRRLTSGGTAALKQARTVAEEMVDSSSEALVVEANRPGGALPAAASWLSRRGGKRDVVVVSDFQAGAIVDGDLVALTGGIGVRMVRVASAGGPASATVRGIEVEMTGEGTRATWPAAVSADTMPGVTVLAGDRDGSQVAASVGAARAITHGLADVSRNVAIVFPGAVERRTLSSGTLPLDSAWQGDLILALQRNPILSSVAQRTNAEKSCETIGVVVARDYWGLPVATVAQRAGGVYVFACVEPGTLAATALIAATQSALNAPPPLNELEPNFLPDESLRKWERPGTESAPRGPGETSPDGRWIWLLALAFLVAEEVVRRRSPHRPTPRIEEVRHERVA